MQCFSRIGHSPDCPENRAGLPEAIDLLLLDGAKEIYPEILFLVKSRLRPVLGLTAPAPRPIPRLNLEEKHP